MASGDAEHQQNASESAPTPWSEALHEVILDQYPWSVAVPYALAHAPRADRLDRLRRLLQSYECALRLTGILLWADHLKHGTWLPRVALASVGLSAPCVDRWLELIQAIANAPTPATCLSPALRHHAGHLLHLRVKGKLVHPAMRLLKERMERHSADWSTEELESVLDRHLPLMQAAIAALSPLADIELVGKADHQKLLVLKGQHDDLHSRPNTDDRLDKTLKHHAVVALCGNRRLGLGPLAVLPLALKSGGRDGMALYDGAAYGSALYQGAHSYERRSDTAAKLQMLFEATRWDLSKSPGPYEALERRAAQHTQLALMAVQGSRYVPSTYLEREDVDGRLQGFLGDNTSVCLVLGQPGSGRASLLCRTAEMMREAPGSKDIPLLCLDAATGLTRRFIDVLSQGDAEDLDELLEAWAKHAPPGKRLILMTNVHPWAHKAPEPFKTLDVLALTIHTINERAGRTVIKLIVTADAAQFHLARGQWRRDHDTPCFDHAFAMAHFPGHGTERHPYMMLPGLTPDQAARIYAWAAHTITKPCPAPWNQLAPSVQEAMTRPLSIRLFHMAFSGVTRPAPEHCHDDALWDLWLTNQTQTHGNALVDHAQRLMEATTTHSRGRLNPTLLFETRHRWVESHKNQPDRTTADTSPSTLLERAGIIHPTPDAGWTLCWPSMDATLALWATGDDDGLERWTLLPKTALVSAMKVTSGARRWRRSAPDLMDLFPPQEDHSDETELARVLSDAAPCNDPSSKNSWLGQLTALMGQADNPGDMARWKRVLLWGVYPMLRASSQSAQTQRRLLESLAPIAGQLTARAPDNLEHLRDLTRIYQHLRALTELLEPDAARGWAERADVMSRRLAEQRSIHTGLSGHSYLQDLARAYRAMGPMIQKHLGHLDASDTRSWQRLTGAYQRLGIRQMTQQDRQGARDWLHKSRALAEHLSKVESPDKAGLQSIAEIYRRLTLLERDENPSDAMRWTRRRINAVKSLMALEPDNIEYPRALARCFNRMGEMEEPRSLPNARDWYQRAMDIREQLTDTQPGNDALMVELSNAYHRMGQIDRHLHPHHASQWFQKDLDLCARLVSLHPNNTTHARNLAIAYYRLGQALMEDDPQKARQCFERDVALSEQLLSDQNNIEQLGELVRSYQHLIDLDQQARPSHAHRWATAALTHARRMAVLQNDKPEAIATLSLLYQTLGTLDMATNPKEATRWLEALDALCQAHGDAAAPGSSALALRADCQGKLGHIHLNAKALKDAQQWLTQALATRRALLKTTPDLSTLRAAIDDCRTMAELATEDPKEERRWLGQALELLDNDQLAPANENRLRVALVCDRMAQIDARHDGRWESRALDARLELVNLDAHPGRFARRLTRMLYQEGTLQMGEDPTEAVRSWLHQLNDGLTMALASDRKNPLHQRNLALCTLLLGDFELAHDPDKGRTLHHKALARFERLASVHFDDARYTRDLAWSLQRNAKILKQQQPAKARAFNARQIDAWKRLLELDPEHREGSQALAEAYDLMAHLAGPLEPQWKAKALAIRERLGH